MRQPGSSPLTRGKQRESLDGILPCRLIPAHAGKTPRGGASRCGQRAHPRSRGENASYKTPTGSLSGSSPLTRGKRSCVTRVSKRARLIPAHAGKTVHTLHCGGLYGAHPRSRGENTDEELAAGMSGGSSPLTRGKRVLDRCARRAVGLIPAHAGKTSLYCRPRRRSGAHPRSRGENCCKPASVDQGVGSSPLTRGKLPRYSAVMILVRLIPAHAGKT